jgi:hypothetical protein
MARSNHPVIFIGRAEFRRMPILSLAFIQAQARFSVERDLSSEPTLLSGGDRKAQGKARQAQQSMLRTPRRVERNWWLPAYGWLDCTCPRCKKRMLLEEIEEDAQVICDRCHRPFW